MKFFVIFGSLIAACQGQGGGDLLVNIFRNLGWTIPGFSSQPQGFSQNFPEQRSTFGSNNFPTTGQRNPEDFQSQQPMLNNPTAQQPPLPQFMETAYPFIRVQDETFVALPAAGSKSAALPSPSSNSAGSSSSGSSAGSGSGSGTGSGAAAPPPGNNPPKKYSLGTAGKYARAQACPAGTRPAVIKTAEDLADFKSTASIPQAGKYYIGLTVYWKNGDGTPFYLNNDYWSPDNPKEMAAFYPANCLGYYTYRDPGIITQACDGLGFTKGLCQDKTKLTTMFLGSYPATFQGRQPKAVETCSQVATNQLAVINSDAVNQAALTAMGENAAFISGEKQSNKWIWSNGDLYNPATDVLKGSLSSGPNCVVYQNGAISSSGCLDSLQTICEKTA